MSYTGWSIIIFFSLIWIWGWVASVSETSVGQMPWGFRKIGNIILLFFIWWYVAFAMMNQGDR